MVFKKLIGLLFILLSTNVYCQTTLRNYLLSFCKNYEKYYNVQVSALTYANWAASYEKVNINLNTQIDKETEKSLNWALSEISFEDISSRLFSSSFDSVIKYIARYNNSTEARVLSHYNEYIHVNNSVINNSILLVPFERAIFDTLYQLSVMEKRGSITAAAVVYTLTIQELEEKGGNKYRFQSFTRQDYNVLREELLHNLIEIDKHLRKKSAYDIILDLYPGKFFLADAVINSSINKFRNINNRDDWSREWKWVWEFLN